MATRFDHNGNLYEIIEGTNEVILRMLSCSCSGKVYIPKYAMYQEKQYTVTSIDGGEWQCYSRVNLNEYDRRKKEIWVTKKHSVITLNIKGHPIDDNLRFSSNKDDCITSIDIPDSVKTIGPSAFEYFSNLRNINIPNSVTSIGKRAFCGCLRLEDLLIPDSVTSIGREAFRDCKSLKNITISRNLKIINESVFAIDDSNKINRNITHISIPVSVVEIKNNAFKGFYPLLEVDIYNEPFEIMIAADAFPARARISYIGKHLVLSSIIEAVSATISKSISTKKTTNPEYTKSGAIDLDKLIDAAVADGVVTEKERTVILKKATAAGYDADEIEILLDGKLAEKQAMSTQVSTEKEVVSAFPKEVKLIKKQDTSTAKVEKDAEGTISLNLAKSTTVAELKQVFNKFYGAKLRIYLGRSQAEENATLGEVGLSVEGTYCCVASLTVGTFIESMSSRYGLKVKVYTCDEWVAALEELTLIAAGMIKKNATKADMEKFLFTNESAMLEKVSDVMTSVTWGDYTININTNKSIMVCKSGSMCSNTKEALRDIANAVDFEFDSSWTTQQLGAKLIGFLRKKI